MDLHRNFRELFANENEGKDFIIRSVRRASPVLIMAPHGGRIEPGTSEIAEKIAGEDFSFYSFEGRKSSGNGILHIASTAYDEPVALSMLRGAEVVLTIHGQKGNEEFLSVGGLDEELKRALISEFGKRGLAVLSGFPATDPANICNRGKSGLGIQLELSRGLRDAFARDAKRLELFSTVIRGEIKKPR